LNSVNEDDGVLTLQPVATDKAVAIRMRPSAYSEDG
jgi:hypothetical protein